MQTLMRQAQVLIEQNRMVEAHEIYQKICTQDQNNDAAWMMLGNLNGALGKIVDAEECCRKAIKLNPKLVNAHANLANSLMAQNKFEDAAASFSDALRLQPDLAPAWYMLGKVQREIGKWNDAEVSFCNAVKLNPGWWDARLLFGNVLQFVGKYQDANQQYEIIIQNQVNNAEAYYRLAVSLSSMGKSDEAEANYRKTLELKPKHLSALNSLSMILAARNQTSEALECCEHALNINSGDINAACVASAIYEMMGDASKAYQYLKPHLDSGVRQLNLALAFAAVSKELGFQEKSILMMEELLEQEFKLNNTQRRNLYFSLGKLCDGTGQFDRAFKHYRKGNKLRQTKFDPYKQNGKTDRCINIQSADFFSKVPRSSNKSDRPVFIVGMPRSGTSLVEQILGSHPLMYGAGELSDIGKLLHTLSSELNTNEHYPEILEFVTKKTLNQCADKYLQKLDELDVNSLRVINKMPSNFYFLGFIELMFPNARIIHCMRNPIDNCLSCYFQDFFQDIDWCYDQKNLIAYYRNYERLMVHWKRVLNIKIMDVSYEMLVSDQENISRKLIEFCGLDWDDNCLRFYKTKRFVATASYDQVRKPMYTKSVSRWKNYRKHIGLLINEFDSGSGV